MLEKATIKPTKLNIVLGLLALLLAFGGVLGFTLTARADSGLDEIVDWVDWDEVAAKTIGVDVDALFDEMMDGDKSIADVAQAHNVEPQQVIDAIVTAEKERLDSLVSEGEMSREEADEWELEKEVAFFVKVTGWVDWFGVAAKTIGVEVDALFAGMSEDKSIADVAKANNVDPQKVLDAIVAAEGNWLKAQVNNGALSQEEADEWLAAENGLAEAVRFFVEQTGGGEEFDVEFMDGVDWFDVAAKTVGVDADALFDEWAEGSKSLADVVQAHNVEAQKVIDAIMTAEKEWLDSLVSEGEMSRKEADEWLTELENEVVFFVKVTGWVDWFDVAAKTVGVDADALFDEWAEGSKSLADVAQAHNVEAQKVIDAIVAAEKAWLDEQVANGALSQKDADEWYATYAAQDELEEEVRAFVEETGDVFEDFDLLDELPAESLFSSPIF